MSALTALGGARGLSRPDWRLVPAALAVWSAALLGLLFGWGLGYVMAGSAGLLGVFVLVAARRASDAPGRRWHRLGVGVSLLICAVLIAWPLSARLRHAAEDPLRGSAARGADAQLRVVITERPHPISSAGFGGRQAGVVAVALPAEVRHVSVDGTALASTGLVTLVAPSSPGWANLLPGQELLADGQLEPAGRASLTVAVLRVRGPPGEVSAAPPWQRLAERLRSGLRAGAGVLPHPQAGLLPALVVGDTDGLDRRVVEEFRIAGMSHLLAVSGTNLAIICVAILLLLRALRIGPIGSALGAGAGVVAFVVLAGPEPSVLRAAVMAGVGLCAMAFGRQRSALPALAASVIGLVLHDPAMAVSFGFALSVLATGALVLIAPRWADSLVGRGVPRGLAEALAVPAAAHVVTAPVVAGMAGQISLVAVVANVLAAPVVAPATVVGVLVAVVAPMSSWLAELLARVAGPEVHWLITVGRHAAAVPGAALDWPRGWWGGLLLCLITVVTLAALRHRKLRVIVAAMLTGLLIVIVPVRVISPNWPPVGWTAVACDVGQGDAVVMSTTVAGQAVVVDTGPEAAALAGCLRRLDVSDIPVVILSHLHADHIGGLAALLADYHVGTVLVGAGRAPAWAWNQVRDETQRAGVPVQTVQPGQQLRWPDLVLDVIGPVGSVSQVDGAASGTEINNGSLVLRASTRSGRMLLTGDVELLAQLALLGTGEDLTAEVLKVPHHGSRYSMPAFLAAVHPKVALVSVGAGNRYGHPSAETLERLTGAGAAVLRTDVDGDTAVLPGDSGPQPVGRGSPRGPPRAQ